MYFTHSGFPKNKPAGYRGEDGDIWLVLAYHFKLAFSEEEARQVIDVLRRALGDEIDTPPSENLADIYREAYFAGMAAGPAPGAD